MNIFKESSVLVIGNGALSRGIKKYIPGSTIIKRPDYDIRNEFIIPDIQPGVAVICASVTSFGMCDKYPEWSRSINVTHTKKIAQILHSAGWNVVMLSSSAAINSHGEYGRQKKDLEDQWSFGPILRLPKVITYDVPIIDSWIRLLRNNEKIQAFAHGIIQPIPRKSVSDSLLILENIKDGLYEIAGPICTWYDLAVNIAKELNKDTSLVIEREFSASYELLNNNKMVNLGWHQYSLPEIANIVIDEWNNED
jgi:dTDP-4-dehydrorhamnose reductase